MRGASDDADLLRLEIFGAQLRQHCLFPRNEARRRAVVGIGEIHALANGRRRRHRRDRRIAAVRRQRIQQRLETAHLDRAGHLDLGAQQPRKIDVEAGGIAVRSGEIERRVVGLGEEADHGDARQVGPVGTPARIPETRDGLRRGRQVCSGSWRRHLSLRMGGRQRRERKTWHKDQSEHFGSHQVLLAASAM